jgi:hypothetical protein
MTPGVIAFSVASAFSRGEAATIAAIAGATGGIGIALPVLAACTEWLNASPASITELRA